MAKPRSAKSTGSAKTAQTRAGKATMGAPAQSTRAGLLRTPPVPTDKQIRDREACIDHTHTAAGPPLAAPARAPRRALRRAAAPPQTTPAPVESS
jgi:hypothetical protein